MTLKFYLLKFESARQKMIDMGANPFILEYKGQSQYDFYKLGTFGLKNLPSVKSIYFSVRSFETGNLPHPWTYTSGVYPGFYSQVVGFGGEGIVIQGKWAGIKAAFKFVQLRNQKISNDATESLNGLYDKLSQMIEMDTTSGSKILNLLGHFR